MELKLQGIMSEILLPNVSYSHRKEMLYGVQFGKVHWLNGYGTLAQWVEVKIH